jgi:glycosyltransferase involved in cell wall biosynthesis
MTNKQQRKSVAIVAPFGYATVIQSVMNTARYIASQGYDVDLFMTTDSRFSFITFAEENIKVHYFQISILDKLFARTIFARYIDIKILQAVESALSRFGSGNSYAFVIGFEPNGIIMAGIMSLIWRVPCVYHSLEIPDLVSNPSSYNIPLFLERHFAQSAIYCLTQDEQRCDVLALQYDLPREKLLVVYNSPIGDEKFPQKSTYLIDKFKIENKQIVLAVGSLQLQHYIDEIVRSVDDWPDNFVLVVHGWFGNAKDEQAIRSEADSRTEKVFISTELLGDEEKYQVFQSADVGLVFFKPINNNFLYAAGSAGKLYDFMRSGVPIIANNLPGMKEIIEQDNDCGIVVDSPQEIGKALPEILKGYESFQQSALNAYSSYEFGQCYSKVLKSIESHL